MSSTSFDFYMVFHQVTGWLDLAILVTGLVISIRYRHLSAWMFVVIGAFLAFCAQSGLGLTLSLVQMLQQGSGGQFITAGYTLLSLLGMIALASLVVGLALVWKDIRDRFQRLRELHEDRSAPSPGAPS